MELILSIAVATLSILSGYLLFCVIYISRKHNNLVHFVSNAAKQHNELCKDLSVRFDAVEEYKKAYNTLVEAHNRLTERVNHVYENWESEWDSGNSWKKGYTQEELEGDEPE